nr:zinc-dependent metalloprotease family protein [uncultured Flavobacterium sp.]
MNRILFFVLLVFSFSAVNAQKASPWKRINQGGISFSDRVNAKPDLAGQLVFELDEMAMSQSLQLANGKTAKESQVQITIPNAKGILETFLVWESSNFAPELQAKFPDIRAYAGTGITDRNATIHFSFSPKGIQTMILRGDSESEFIERYAKSKSVYVLFNSKTRKKGNLSFACKTEDVALNKQLYKKTSKISSNTGVFKTLRLALSCTGEYTVFHGGTVNGALTAMNATMARVNGIFNKDLAIQLNLVATNADIIYTNALTDPYSDETVGLATVAGCTGDCPGTWNKEVQSTITTVIGEANYDIGHLFAATGGGGDAGCIGCICDALTTTNSTPPYQLGKGSAYTSPSDGISQGDTFDIDFVAHEMGHQLGANHTYSYDIEGTGMSVEPGSGSTIMGYAGITDYNVQSNSDDYFTYVSIKQIQDNLSNKSCPVSTTLTSQTPTVNAGADFTIPKGTAFVLTGTGSDPNGNTLTYCWEQNDTAITESGANSLTFPTKVDGPLFRSLKPTSSPIRYMPALNSVLINKLSTTWESVSDVARTLHFTLTARDNAAQGFAQTNTDTKIVTVSGTIGPFAVTSQNVVDSGWPLGSSQTITWSVNNTNNLPGSSNVNIKLSTDGGLTFPIVLAANTPNDGSETITAPGVAETNCRILIEPTANIYYAINSEPFAIGYSVTSTCNTYPFTSTSFAIVDSQSYTTKTITVPASSGVISDVNIAVDFTHTYLSDVQIEVINPQGTTVKLFERSCNQSGNLILNYDDLGVALACGTTTAQTVSPFEPLSVFNGLNPQGNWQFRVRDAYVSDTGTLNSAAITICTKSYATLAAPSFDIGNFVVYPNPNKGNFNIQFISTAMSGVKVLVHDLLGRKIYENKFSNGVNFNENIQLKNVRTGIYLLTVIDGDRKEVKKLVIE